MSSFLQKHTRQPKLYIDLPSNGRHYPKGVLVDDSPTNLPVFGMTANDEIMIKTPDALFAGQATVEVIKNCIPNITDPWKMPTIDVDHCLIAIRMATHGNSLPLGTTCPHCDTQQDVDVNLNTLIEQSATKVFRDTVTINDLTFTLKPLDYRKQSDLQRRLYEAQRQLSSIPTNTPEDEKKKLITGLLSHSTKLQVETILSFVDKISDGSDEEANPEQIEEFLVSGDAVYYNQLRKTVEEIRKEWDSKLIPKNCDNEECGKEYKFAVTLDYANFFGPRS